MRLVVYLCGLLLSGLFIILSCVNTRTNANIENNKVSNMTESRLVGTYRGSLPCTDCDAIATSLTLSNDRGYSLKYIYMGKSAKSFSKTDRKSTRLNSSHVKISYAVFCLKKKKI